MQHSGLTSKSAPRGQARGGGSGDGDFSPFVGIPLAKHHGEGDRERNTKAVVGPLGMPRFAVSGNPEEKMRGGEKPNARKGGAENQLVEVSTKNVAARASVPRGSDGRMQLP